MPGYSDLEITDSLPDLIELDGSFSDEINDTDFLAEMDFLKQENYELKEMIYAITEIVAPGQTISTWDIHRIRNVLEGKDRYAL